MHLQLVFENAAIAVLDKPHWLPVMPSGKYASHNAVSLLRAQMACAELAPAHRIDRDTAGLVLFTKSKALRGAYQNLFRDRVVDKTYLAIAPYRGALEQGERDGLTVRHTHLARSAEHFMQQVEHTHDAAGKPLAPNAHTTLRMLARDGPRALYELKPRTGQRHQLRVHMAALGVPIAHDGIYPVLTPEDAQPHLRSPLQLLAWRLGFVDPLSGESLCWHSRFRLDWPAAQWPVAG